MATALPTTPTALSTRSPVTPVISPDVEIQPGGKVSAKDVRRLLSAGRSRPGSSASDGLGSPKVASPPQLPRSQEAAAARVIREEEKFVQKATAGSFKQLKALSKQRAAEASAGAPEPRMS